MELFMQSSILFRIIEFIFRIIGMIVFGFMGVAFGGWLAGLFELPGSTQVYLYRWLFLLLGGLGGFILTPYITTRPARAIRIKLGHLSAETLFGARRSALGQNCQTWVLASPHERLSCRRLRTDDR